LLELPRFRGRVSAWVSSGFWGWDGVLGGKGFSVGMTPFEIDRRYPSESGMTPSWVIPTFDVREQRDPRRRLGRKAAAIKELALQAGKEAFRHRVVVGVTDAAHRWANAHLRAALAECDTGVLGQFNPSSQHFLIGGVDGYKKVGSGSSWTWKDAVARATSRAASIGAAAVLAGDRRRMLERRRRAGGGSVAGGWGQMVSGVWRYAAIASCAVVTAGIGTILVVG
jgi:hypothetical protein